MHAQIQWQEVPAILSQNTAPLQPLQIASFSLAENHSQIAQLSSSALLETTTRSSIGYALMVLYMVPAVEYIPLAWKRPGAYMTGTLVE